MLRASARATRRRQAAEDARLTPRARMPREMMRWQFMGGRPPTALPTLAQSTRALSACSAASSRCSTPKPDEWLAGASTRRKPSMGPCGTVVLSRGSDCASRPGSEGARPSVR